MMVRLIRRVCVLLLTSAFTLPNAVTISQAMKAADFILASGEMH